MISSTAWSGLSTHDLTRRSTQKVNFYCTILIFQLTTSQGGRPGGAIYRVIEKCFQLTTSQGGRPCYSCNDRTTGAFQLTTSQGGRPECIADRDCELFLSTHDLTRRSTKESYTSNIPSIFQLTTSQGGRQGDKMAD